MKRNLHRAGMILAIVVGVSVGAMFGHSIFVHPTSSTAAPAVNQAQVADFSSKQRDFDARLQTIMYRYDCTTDVNHWQAQHPSAFPRHMVLQATDSFGRFTWDIDVKPWSMKPADIDGGIVKMLCLK